MHYTDQKLTVYICNVTKDFFFK